MLKRKIWKPFALAVFFITLLAALLSALLLIRIDVLPGKYLIVFFALEAVALALSALLLFAGMRKKPSGGRRARRIFGFLLSLLLVAGNLFAAYLIATLDRTKENITALRDRVAVVGVYVLQGDAAQSLADTAGARYGVLGGFEKSNSDRALAEIEERLGAAVEAEEFAAIAEAAAALRSGTVRVLAVNENHLSLLDGSEDFAGFAGEVRLLERIELPQTAALFSPAEGGGFSLGSLLPETEAETEQSQQLSTGEKIRGDKSVVFYLSGNDSLTFTLSNGRSDVNILMAVDPVNDQILLLNTPRDYYVPNPALGGGLDKLTHCGLFGTYNSMAALEGLYGVGIDNYLQINFTGFVKLIDALGGVTLDNPRAFYSSSGYFFPQGVIDLDGYQALAYGRERDAFGDGDLARGRNLMRLIGAMVDKAKSSGASLLMNYPGILDSLEGMFATDLTTEEISALVKLAIRDLSRWEVKTVSVSGSGGMMPTAAGGSVPLYVMWPDQTQVAHASALLEKAVNGEWIDPGELD